MTLYFMLFVISSLEFVFCFLPFAFNLMTTFKQSTLKIDLVTYKRFFFKPNN